jgi:hypothetical protein
LGDAMNREATTMNTIQQNGTMREDFGGKSLATTSETSTAALAASAQAAVNARFIMAMQRPRNWDDVRVRILRECERPGFAEVARYRKPIGKGVEGASIRLAEAFLRYAGNMGAPMTVTFEDRFVRRLHVEAIDFETNASYGADITVEKTVERHESKGRAVLGERRNTSGSIVFIVEATEDELLNKQNALVSKAVRTLVLRLIPGDLIDEAEAVCIRTLQTRAQKDPDGEKKRLCDAFARVGVFPADLAVYLGHSLDAVQPAELVELREVYATVRDGETTWAATLEAKRGPSKDGAAGAANLDEKLAQRRAKKQAKAAPAPQTAEAPVPAHDASTGELSPEEQAALEAGK